MKRLLWLMIVFPLVINQAWAQDVTRLRERCSALWVERIAGDRVKASAFVEEKSRKDFISSYEPTVRKFTIVGIEFPNKPNTLLVTVKAQLSLPVIGEVERTVVEPWVWTDRNWYLQVLPTANPFSSTSNTAPVDEDPLGFELLDSRIDLGTHTQGQLIKGSVRFKANRVNVAGMREHRIDGLKITKVNWQDANGGTIDFTIDTTLISESIDTDAEFEAFGSLTVKKKATVPLTAKIDGRVRFSQTPELVNSTIDGTMEVAIENISNMPITISRVKTLHSSFDVPFEQPVTLKPGESTKVPISYKAQKLPKAATLHIFFADNLFPKYVSLPLKTWVARAVQESMTPQRMQEIYREQQKQQKQKKQP
jgi:hypothetical protein